MALRTWKCCRCDKKSHVFEGEEDGKLYQYTTECRYPMAWCHGWVKLPIRPVTVHATQRYMSDSQLDSWATVYELDKQLNREVAEEKELSIFNDVRKNL